MQSAKCKLQSAKYKVQSAKYKVQSTCTRGKGDSKPAYYSQLYMFPVVDVVPLL